MSKEQLYPWWDSYVSSANCKCVILSQQYNLKLLTICNVKGVAYIGEPTDCCYI